MVLILSYSIALENNTTADNYWYIKPYPGIPAEGFFTPVSYIALFALLSLFALVSPWLYLGELGSC